MTVITPRAKRALQAAAATGATLALLAVAPLSASAAIVPLHIDNGAGSSPAAIYTGGSGSHTIEISGEGFDYNPAWAGWLFSDAGIYVAFGPDVEIEDVYLEASTFASHAGGQFWVHNGADATASDEWELTTAGDFDGLALTVQSTFSDGDANSFTCTSGPTDTTAGRVDCFVYTLSAHGSWDRGNDNKIPVYFG
ncbi:hypothetical protein [Microbacterium gilvum]|uniref:Uncharacterized protein n=1 Tax=Microbacterium gilvum TaxID=1336204 RepID=A0ABP9A0P2_9MICO